MASAYAKKYIVQVRDRFDDELGEWTDQISHKTMQAAKETMAAYRAGGYPAKQLRIRPFDPTVIRRNPRVKLPSKPTDAKVWVDGKGNLKVALKSNPMTAKGGRVCKNVKSVERAGNPRGVRMPAGTQVWIVRGTKYYRKQHATDVALQLARKSGRSVKVTSPGKGTVAVASPRGTLGI